MMNKISKLAMITLLAFYVCETNANKFIDECVEKTKATTEDMMANPPKTPASWCFMKCLAEKNRIIDSQGNPMIDTLEQTIASVTSISDKNKKEFIKCIKAMGKIKKCEDISQVYACWDILHK